jgi:hypothetical protein
LRVVTFGFDNDSDEGSDEVDKAMIRQAAGHSVSAMDSDQKMSEDAYAQHVGKSEKVCQDEEIVQAEYGAEVQQEEEKIASDRAAKLSQKSSESKRTDEIRHQAPFALIEGPEPSQDLSYKWVTKYENVREIEKGVLLKEFNDSMQARELDAEFRLIRKLTETKEHLSNCETFDKKTNALLNRYAELKPCK